MSELPIPAAMVDRTVEPLWRDDILSTLCEYVRIPCVSPAYDAEWAEHGHLARAAELLADWCRHRPLAGATVQLATLPGRTPVLVVDVPASGGAPAGAPDTVLFYGHLDKQPPLGTWREGLDPYRPVREGSRLFGRGTADDGYAVFAALAAIETVDRAGMPRPRCLVLIEASEESGSPDLLDHLDALAPVIGQPSLVLCLDSGCPTYDRLWLTSSLRGNLVATVTVEVLTEGLHSGSVGGVVPSSFRILRQLLSRVEDERTGEILLPELRAPVPEAHDRALRATAASLGPDLQPRLPTIPGLRLAGHDEGDRLVLQAWSTALAVTGLEGAPPARDAGNVLRPSTTAKLSVRLPPPCDATGAADALRHALTTEPPSGARVQVEMDPPADGWVAPTLPPWMDAVLTTASRAHFGQPLAMAGEGGTIPFLSMLGRRFPDTPMIATGVLGPGSNAHGPNESLHLPTARAVTACSAQLLAAAGETR